MWNKLYKPFHLRTHVCTYLQTPILSVTIEVQLQDLKNQNEINGYAHLKQMQENKMYIKKKIEN